MAAVAHVVAEDSGVGFVPQPGQQLFYDEAAGCLHLIEGRMITAVALPQPRAPAPLYGSTHGGSSSQEGIGGGGASPDASAHGAQSSGATGPPPPPRQLGHAPSSHSHGHHHSHHRRSPSLGIDPAGYDSDSSIASSTARAFLVSEGPPVRHIRSSLDGAFTALHRSARLVEFHCHATGNMFVEAAGADRAGRRGGDPTLLGFFWTAAHFVMVTGSGLEIHSVHPSLQGLRLDTALPLQGVQWYTYSPETHMVVLGFGSSGAKLQAFQFSKAGTLKLPLLDLTPPWGSPIRPAQAATLSAALDGFSSAREQPARLVGPDTCWVAVLYGRVFCCHHDRGAGVLRLYRLFRDATSLAHSYEVYARQLELSVVDNVLLVHHIDSAVVMLIDIMAAGPAPISSPLPLAVPLAHDHAPDSPLPPSSSSRGSSRPASAAGEAAAASAAGMGGAAAGLEAGLAAGALAQPPAAPPAPAGPSPLQLHYPSWLVDAASGLIYRLQLDLQAVADSSQSDFARLLAFLQRRRPSAAPRRDAASITLRVLRGLVQEEAPLPELRAAFDVVNSFAAEAAAAAAAAAAGAPGTSAQQQQPRAGGSVSPLRRGGVPRRAAQQQQPRPTVSPQDAYNSAFSLLHAQGRCPPGRLQAALAEYVASCCSHGLGLGGASSLAALYVDLLLEQGLPHLVPPLLLSHPQLDSVVLAEHVEEAAAAGQLPGGAQLAEQLLARLGAHEARCHLLLRLGKAREALLLARRHRLLGSLAPAALLEAAGESGGELLRAAAQRVVCAGGV